uniref:Peptidase family M48 n=3 Tax=Candidatus Kentrum sp. MB TaxID=2138164 RepID=A0A451BH70_9GAMM|nr:MAG: Peptidase family M48 [Candidatus Kentron sp. MB]VFK77634.1 MAG: Peptidase family M48 [Candidatus Kentron sp. MB]
MRALAILSLIILLAACAAPQTRMPEVTSVAAKIEAKKQRELAVEALIEMEKRLYIVGYPLLTNGAPLCGDNVSPSTGMVVWNNYHFDGKWREPLKSKYGLADLIQVAYVSPNSPAENAGIQAGDLPVSLNGWAVPVGENAIEKFSNKLDELEKESTTMNFVMRRGTKNIPVSVVPTPACNIELVLSNKDEKNAYADGKRIVVYRGLMEFFKTDQEAALVIAHELAHNTMGHIDAKKTNAAIGGLIGLIVDVAAAAGGVNTQGQFADLGSSVGAGTYSVEFEKEADYVGLYFMALAGYEIKGAADFWRRMAIQNPKSIDLRSTHPTTPERFIGIEKTIAEIQGKIERNMPLEPEFQKEDQEDHEEEEDAS